MLEKTVERKVCLYAEKRGWLVRKFTSPSRRSVPDRILMKDGKAIFIEFKAPGRKPTDLQKLEHERLRAHGMTVHVIDNIEAGYALFAK